MMWNRADLITSFNDFLRIGREEIAKDSKVYIDTLTDRGFMEYIFEDYQLVLTKSIQANRIIRIVAPEVEFGRDLYKDKKQKHIDG